MTDRREEEDAARSGQLTKNRRQAAELPESRQVDLTHYEGSTITMRGLGQAG